MVLGLAVVGRLAARSGIHVRLAESPFEGVTAQVRVPFDLLQTPTAEPSGTVRDAAGARRCEPARRRRRRRRRSFPLLTGAARTGAVVGTVVVAAPAGCAGHGVAPVAASALRRRRRCPTRHPPAPTRAGPAAPAAARHRLRPRRRPAPPPPPPPAAGRARRPDGSTAAPPPQPATPRPPAPPAPIAAPAVRTGPTVAARARADIGDAGRRRPASRRPAGASCSGSRVPTCSRAGPAATCHRRRRSTVSAEAIRDALSSFQYGYPAAPDHPAPDARRTT